MWEVLDGVSQKEDNHDGSAMGDDAHTVRHCDSDRTLCLGATDYIRNSLGGQGLFCRWMLLVHGGSL